MDPVGTAELASLRAENERLRSWVNDVTQTLQAAKDAQEARARYEKALVIHTGVEYLRPNAGSEVLRFGDPVADEITGQFLDTIQKAAGYLMGLADRWSELSEQLAAKDDRIAELERQVEMSRIRPPSPIRHQRGQVPPDVTSIDPIELPSEESSAS